MALGDNDLPVFFSDFGVEVAFGGSSVQGIVDEPVSIQIMGQGVSGMATKTVEVRVPYNAWSPMPLVGSNLVLNGEQQYTLKEPPTAEGDGKIVCLKLKVAP